MHEHIFYDVNISKFYYVLNSVTSSLNALLKQGYGYTYESRHCI